MLFPQTAEKGWKELKKKKSFTQVKVKLLFFKNTGAQKVTLLQ